MVLAQAACLVTGASGFVGSAIVAALREKGRHVVALARSDDGGGCYQCGPTLDALADWTDVLKGIGVVVHAAARVHVMNEREQDPLAAFRAVNVAGTLALARQAAAAGVRRFVFISSIKVNGERTVTDRPFSASDPPAPEDAYGVSKMEAEAGLFEIAAETGLEVVVVRPPLVYGPGVRANFERMMYCLWRGIPLPLGAVDNRRSLVGLDNLVSLIETCIHHPAAANQVFLASDGEDVSTAMLLERLGAALGRPARLVRVPPVLLCAGAAMLGRRDMARRLLGSLQLDITRTRELLGWTPPVSLEQGLKRAALAFLEQHRV